MVVIYVTSYSLYLSLQVHDEIYPKKTLTPKEIGFDDSEGFIYIAGYGFYEIDGEGCYFNNCMGKSKILMITWECHNTPKS